MKKKTKRIMAGVLALGIAFNTPAYAEAAEAVGQKRMPFTFEMREYIIDREETSEEAPEADMSEDAPDDIPESSKDSTSESASNTTSESIAEEQPSNTSEEGSIEAAGNITEESALEENITEENNTKESETEENITEENALEESTSEASASEMSENASWGLPVHAEIYEEEAPVENNSKKKDDDNKKNNEFTMKMEKAAGILPEVTDRGFLDYRTYVAGTASPEISIKVVESMSVFPPTGRMNVGTGGKELSEDELANLHYAFHLEKGGIVEPGYMEKSCVHDNSKSCFKDAMTLKVIGVGETEYTVQAIGDSARTIYAGYGTIKVQNSPLFDSDFYIEVSGGRHQKDYTYDEWKAYLQAHDNWVDGDVHIRLSDTGQKYYTAVESQETGSADKKKTYTLWAENPQRNASTKEEKNGTRSYTVGIDKAAPVLTAFAAGSKCYEPTKTDTEQYFAEDFVLNGTFEDSGSGLDRIEYTTNAKAGDQAEWTEIVAGKHGAANCDFQIRLPDGCYNAVAVRAYDMMGNVSAEQGFVNEQGEFIKVIVDQSEPVMSMRVTSDNQPYNGENDNWTNKDIIFHMTADAESCPYAGIELLEYKYEKIGEVSDTINMDGEWTALPWQDKPEAELAIKDDKNGYYSFRAVSRSGIATKDIVRERVLVQHQAADPKQMIVSGVDDKKRINEWYNKESGVPNIHFEYPEYDTGAVSKAYDAPITMHYKLTAEPNEFSQAPANIEKSAAIGVMNSENGRGFAVTKDELDGFMVDFGYNAETREAQDGIYTLEYWITDKAGNESERQVQVYKIDTHEPTDMMVMIDKSEFPVGQESTIVYDKFYRDTVTGRASAQYGISGKGMLQIKRAKKPGEWKEMDNTGFDGEDNVDINPNTRCFLYVRAQDQAGNIAEGWTMGLAVDNLAPNEENNMSLIMEPEGANEHGFFNQDVDVRINIQDAPEDDNCAALMSVLDSIGRDGVDTITDNELFSFIKEQPTNEELAQAASFETVQVIDAKENESNDAYIEVTAADRAGNTKTSIQLLKVDVTKPEISIEFDNNNAVNKNFYHEKRIATIHVTERNFDPASVYIEVQKNGNASDFEMSGWRSDGIEHYATIAFTEDGNYAIAASCTDLADNQSEQVQTETFTIDCTAPEIRLELIAEQETQIQTKEYYNTGIKARISVTEHNFNEHDFVMNISPAVTKGAWSHDGDVHTMQILFDDEHTYHIDCAYTDLAGNTANHAEKDFTIDTTAPAITIDGIVDGSANMGAILPVVTVLDLNMEESGVGISVISGIGESVKNSIETSAVADGSGAGYRFTLRDMTDKEDNVYYLTVTACDKAGNEAALTYRFSLNRNGSVYDIQQIVSLMDNQYQTCDRLDNLQIVEMNVDTVDEFELYISRNGELGYKAVYSKEISGSENTGYTYVYNIDEKNFTQEGTYRLSLYSRDRAGNEVNNMTDIRGNEISFIVDNTAPKVIINGVESGKVYDVDAQEVQIVVTDNFQLAKAEFTLVNKDNETLGKWDYMELAGEGGTLNITIPQYDGEISLLYRVKDAAGNEKQTFLGDQTALSDFLVTTDKLVQLVNKPTETPLGRSVFFMSGVSMLAAIFFILRSVYRRKFSKG